MINITQAPKDPIQVLQKFTIAGTASPSYAGKELVLTIDNQFKTTGPAVDLDGSWQVSFSFQQPGKRSLVVSVDNEKASVVIQVVAAAPKPLPASRLRITGIPTTVKTEEKFILSGQANGYIDGAQLVIRVDGTVEVARPRVQAGKWQAELLLHQAGKRLIEVIGSEQDKTQTTLDVAPSDDLQIFPRSIWTSQPTPANLPNLQPQRITLHHTAVSPTLAATATQATEIQRIRQLYQIHVSGNGWSDIGYHYVIMPSGRIYVARSELKRGAHDVINDGLGVAFDGVFTSNTITPAQYQSAVELCTKLCQRIGIQDPTVAVATPTSDFGTRNLPRILGHRDRVSTECPGSEGGRTVRMGEIRQAVKQRL